MTENGRHNWSEFSPQADVRRSHLGLPDFVVALGVLALLVFIAHVAAHSMVAFRPPHTLCDLAENKFRLA
jgi:hypothetical protein